MKIDADGNVDISEYYVPTKGIAPVDFPIPVKALKSIGFEDDRDSVTFSWDMSEVLGQFGVSYYIGQVQMDSVSPAAKVIFTKFKYYASYKLSRWRGNVLVATAFDPDGANSSVYQVTGTELIKMPKESREDLSRFLDFALQQQIGEDIIALSDEEVREKEALLSPALVMKSLEDAQEVVTEILPEVEQAAFRMGEAFRVSVH